MGYRRKKDDVNEQRKWSKFINENKYLINEIGIPNQIMEAHENWEIFLVHGYLEFPNVDIPFNIDTLKKNELEKYELLKKLIKKYFQYGYSYFEINAILDEVDLKEFNRLFNT
jgi:hypothetical protein